MAEVRLSLTGAYRIAHKTCNQFFRESRGKQGKPAIYISAISASPQKEFYITVTLDDLGEKGSVAELYHSIGTSKEASLYKLARNNTSDRKSFDTRYRRRTTATHNTHWDRLDSQRTSCTSRFVRPQQSLVGRHLVLDQVSLLFTRAYYSGGHGEPSEPLYKTKTGYYDLLEVPPNATQAQIKTAYYKQSFIYHPDKNHGNEHATVRFSDISEAYNVLGNKGLRKKYDRGILSQTDVTGATRPSASAKDTSSSSSKQQSRTGSSVVGVDSKGMFDFDKFIKEHYSGQLQREKDLRARQEEILKQKNETVSEWKLAELAVVVLLVMTGAIMLSFKRG